MKRALTLVLTIAMLCLSGCQKASTWPDDENTGTPSSEPTYESSGAAYVQKYAELVNQYGEAGVVEDTITEYQQYSYLVGVCVAELFDFNGDGALDLFVVYSNGQYTGKHIRNDEYDIVIPQANSYEIEIWTFKDGELIQLLHQPSVGSYRSFDTEYWDTDSCMVVVYEKPDGLPVIQLYTTSDEGLAYTNIFWGDAGVVTDELYYHKDSFILNGEPISEETWNKHITGYDAILYFARLSNPDWIVDYSGVLNRTKEVVQALLLGESAQLVPVQAEYISFYLREIDRSNRERLDQQDAFPTKYSLYDIDQNGTPELLIKNGNCEADYFYDVFTVLDGELVHCGEFGGSHTSLHTGLQAGLVRYSGQMMVYMIEIIYLDGTELKIETIADGYVEREEWDNGYPELSEFGYGAYNQSLPGCYVTTPAELYMYGVSPIPASPAPTLLTDDEARTICIAWLDNQADLPSYTLIEWEDGLYPEYDFFGEQYYCFAVDGMSASWFRMLVHIETGEMLFMTRTNEDHPNTVVGLLDDWPGREEPTYAQALLTVDEAIAVYDSWLEDHADLSSYTLNRQSYEQFELLREPYYLFHAEEVSMYWYNILVHIETGELLFMMTPDGQYPVKSIELLNDWYDSTYTP